MPVGGKNSLNSLNSLLAPGKLPSFSDIALDQVEPALKHLIGQNLAFIDSLNNKTNIDHAISWESLILPLEKMETQLHNFWSPISHLHSVKDSPELRKVYESCLALLSDYHTKVGQHQGLYNAFLGLSISEDIKSYDAIQRKIIELALRDFKLSGVSLEGEDKQRFAELKQNLSKITTKYEENILDAKSEWMHLIEQESELAGIPEAVKANFKARAMEKNLSGWAIALDHPSFDAVITYCDNRELRQKLYEAYVTRASDQGPHAAKYDNSALMVEIVKNRQALSKLLGFKDYTAYSLANKMAPNPEAVVSFLGELAKKAKPFAEKEIVALNQFAQDSFGHNKLEAWDLAYFSEKLYQKNFSLSQEDLRPYFPLPKVLSGLFEIVRRLYGLIIEEVKGANAVDTWDPSVQFFSIYHETIQKTKGEFIGQFYLDPYAREQKRGGAWMDDARSRAMLSGLEQYPVAYLVCNFRAPEEAKPALLNHDEVLTLFHEFGHGLHHLLTTINYPSISGINQVPWDAVELPSQFMENWAWEPEGLNLISAHIETGEPIPQKLMEQLIAAKNFQAGMFLLRQIEFALFDFRLHQKQDLKNPEQIQVLLDQLRSEISVFIPPKFNRFQHSFSHIFAGGYAAGYYSYLWAEVLALDAFSRFEQEGIFSSQTGGSFLEEVLSKGGSLDPMFLFANFRGRPPSQEAFLRHHGLK
jgi:oligopeptidase A